MKKIAIFASGTGTNAQKIIDHFRTKTAISVGCIVASKPKAGVLEIAKKEGLPFFVLKRKTFRDTTHLLQQLAYRKIDWIVLAGFLWLIPSYLIKAYPNRIVNIHPALLPKYGGKGMYGMHVHEAVKLNKETQTGITIHYVNENYDEGQTIFQASCPVYESDDAQAVSQKVRLLEHEHFPIVIEKLISGLEVQ